MVAKLNKHIRHGRGVFMAILGFFIVFFFPGVVGKSNKASFAHMAHADAPVVDDGGGNINTTNCLAPGCCGSCGDASASDCGSSGGSCAGSCDSSSGSSGNGS